MKQEKRSTQMKKDGTSSVDQKERTVCLYIATKINSGFMGRGFPPPLYHTLIGYGMIFFVERKGGASSPDCLVISSHCNFNSEKDILYLFEREIKNNKATRVVSHATNYFVRPVLKSAAFRTGVSTFALDLPWSGVGESWFEYSGVSMTDIALPIGLGQRTTIDFEKAVASGNFNDIQDQLLLDTFLIFCAWARQQLASGKMELSRCNALLLEAKKKVRYAVRDRRLNRYTSWKQINKELFLLEE